MAHYLPTDVELAAEQRQIVLPGAIAVRQPSPYRSQQAVCEHPDEKLEQRLILSGKTRELVVRDRKSVSHGQHVHESFANGTVGPVDFRQDLNTRLRYGDNADNLTGPQARAGRSGKNGLGDPQLPGCALGKQGEPTRGWFRNAPLPDGQVPPLPNGRGFRHSLTALEPAPSIRNR